ncbi:MAG TPA: ubiquinone/menaquinone biosynthesis methyltransferase [Tepidisphaeraceae bacterium]|nr:ubiquinone/menaquinone biosynthesis methyltransferase [Tepidisphaeraceae bacterium]
MPATDPARDVWNETLLQNPHEVADKRSRVQKMFAAIAPSYDFNNRFHSLGLDQRWRRKAVELAMLGEEDVVVDVACGTGDLTIAFYDALLDAAGKANLYMDLCETFLEEPRRTRYAQMQRYDGMAPPARVLGIDFTFEMLLLARSKIENRKSKISYLNGDALALPLADQSANVLSIAFGIRNVADPLAALKEFHRVLKPGGRLIILEFSLPTNRLLRALYNFYFTKILPRTATWISRDKTGAYKYLPQSVNTFISRDSMQQMMRDAGFTDVQVFPLTFGICICYRGIKQ